MTVMAGKGVTADYPVEDLIRALDFPDTTDRNKAAATLAMLAKTPKYRDAIRADAVPTLLKLLRLKQPNNHDWAYAALKEVSGKTFGDRDYDAWENWASRHHGAAN